MPILRAGRHILSNTPVVYGNDFYKTYIIVKDVLTIAHYQYRTVCDENVQNAINPWISL